MKKKRLIGLTTLFIMVTSVGFLAANYYSVLADVRESFSDIDTTDGYAYGETLFQLRECVFCHTLEAAGATGEVGPPLDGIGTRADVAYIRTSILMPNADIATNCPEGECEPNVMPPFGDVLDPEQVDALVTYLSQQQ